MYIIGIFMEGPNTGACLFRDGELVAMAEEERFNRIKTSSEIFPTNAIKYCLEEARINLQDVGIVATAWDHDKYPAFMNDFMGNIQDRELDELADTNEQIIHEKLSPDLARFNISVALRKIDPLAKPEIHWYSHHECHAASVHYLSGFSDSAILVIDGSGEELSTTTWHGKEQELSVLDTWSLPDSLGWFYASMTEWLGFRAYSGEGKVMGLAAYGKPMPEFGEKLKEFCQPDKEQIYKIDPTYVYYGKRSYSRKFTDKLVDLLGEPRLAESELTDFYIDAAYETQKRLEDVATEICKRLLNQTGSHNLCISGGVAMNCKMNGILSQLPGVEKVFINPASHDSGAAMGAAILAGKDKSINPNRTQLTHAYWGPSFSDNEIEDALAHCGLSFSKPANVASDVAERLSQGEIVGWFQGRAEFGARALGGRSILANPQLTDMKDTINARVKYREGFRPFAPSMLEEVMEQYMVDPKDSPFMILAYWFKESFRELFPSIVHVDGSVRPQTVSRKTNPLYWEMIKTFGDITGHPIVLNTSFNVRGEPIVSTPLDAVRCFYSTGMDSLAIGSFVLSKKG